ncbi:unnamed protein product [Gongylonema pulchrum]|uniref:Kinesin motor domain-containing protein n=1 Tax=Gongylonema pulchrum TaxID=637853 RepID=A0A183D7W6_9BILA|nr:unnamed protein product [Gongylonema pulchrum]
MGDAAKTTFSMLLILSVKDDSSWPSNINLLRCSIKASRNELEDKESIVSSGIAFVSALFEASTDLLIPPLCDGACFIPCRGAIRLVNFGFASSENAGFNIYNMNLASGKLSTLTGIRLKAVQWSAFAVAGRYERKQRVDV